VTFVADGRQTLSGSRDADVRLWQLQKAGTVKPPPDPDPRPGPSVGKALRPAAVLPVGGTISSLHLSPDRQTLYYLNLTEGKLARVDARALRRDRVLRLAEGTDALCLTPDGKTLIATVPVRAGRSVTGRVQIIDPVKLDLRKTFAVDVAPYDVAASDAGLVFVSGATGDWTEVAVIDADKGTVVTRWGGVWNRSFLQLAPDQRRLYYSSQGVTPGTLDALVLPGKLDEKPVTYRAAVPAKQALGGEFQFSPDGRFLLCKTGTVLRASADRDGDLQFHLNVGPFLAAAVDPEIHAAFLLTRDGTLKHYSYPDFKLQGTYPIGIVATQAVCAGKQGKLYVAGFDPRTLAERPRSRGYGDVHVFDLKDLLKN
jgi:hypothetical protein